jgi:hypothetical protein
VLLLSPLKSLLLLLHTSGVVLIIIPFTIEDIFVCLIDSVSVSAATKHIKAIKLKIIYQISIYSCKVIIIICLNKYEIIDVPEQRKELERGPDNNTQNSFKKIEMELVLFFSCVFLCCIIILMIFQNY